MAKATDKSSASPPRGLPLTFYCAQLRVNRVSRSETIRRLTARLTSKDVEVSPPLPPDWHLEFDPEDRLWLMWPDGRRMAQHVWLYENPFKPAPAPPGLMQALYPQDYLDEEPAAAPPESNPPKPGPKPPPLKPKVWWDGIRKVKENQQRRDETSGEYADRLHKLMQSANVTEVWPLGTLRRRLYDK